MISASCTRAGNWLAKEFGESARERPFTRHLGHALPAAQPPQRRVQLQPLDQGRRRRKPEHRLGGQRVGQGAPVVGRASRQTVPCPHEPLDPRHFKHDNEPLVLLGQRPDLSDQPWKQVGLEYATRCLKASRAEASSRPRFEMPVRRGNTMTDADANAALPCMQDEKSRTPLLFC